MQGGWKNYIRAALLAAGCAAVIEAVALAMGHRSYIDRMPMVPLFGVGLGPLLQLTLLVPLTLRIAARGSAK